MRRRNAKAEENQSTDVKTWRMQRTSNRRKEVQIAPAHTLPAHPVGGPVHSHSTVRRLCCAHAHAKNTANTRNTPASAHALRAILMDGVGARGKGRMRCVRASVQACRMRP